MKTEGEKNILHMIKAIQNFFYKIYDFFKKLLDHDLFELAEVPVDTWGILKAIFIIVISYLIAKALSLSLIHFFKKRGKAAEAGLYTFSKIIYYTILFVGILIAFASFGLTFRNMTIILGALSIGIGFGLQNMVKNFLCGLTVLFGKNIKVGDYIETDSGHIGRVTEINVQTTIIHTLDGIDILIPNADLIEKKIINWTKRDPFLRLNIPFGVAYGSDQDTVKKVIIEMAKEHSYTVKNHPDVADPEVWLVELGESSLNFALIVWVNIHRSAGKEALKASYLSEIEKTLKKAHIHIPFPQRDLYIKTLPEQNK